MIYLHNSTHNTYLSGLWYPAMMGYAKEHELPIMDAVNLDGIFDSTIITHGANLFPPQIIDLKSRRNKIVSFDINDSSWLEQAYRMEPEQNDLDLIFKLSGIQKVNFLDDIDFDSEFGISKKSERFLPDEWWDSYRNLADTGKLKSLPYPHWQRGCAPGTLPTFTERSGKALISGGNHFQRVILTFFLMRAGVLDETSCFNTTCYFSPGMTEQFRHCDPCVATYKQHKCYPFRDGARPPECKSPAYWGEDLDLSQPGAWNNKCPASFFWLASRFEEAYGPIDEQLLEKMFNGDGCPMGQFMEKLSNATYYADLKWRFSIYAPPRFWEAAEAGTINLLPRRTVDQDYFPVIEEGRHYITYDEDMSNLNPEITEDKFYEITHLARGLYDRWIAPGKHGLADSLLKHIFDSVEAA